MLLKQSIKDTLKAAGYNQSKVSVRERSCGYSQAYTITVRSKDININTIIDLLKHNELQRRCEASGDYLQGANVFIDYTYSNKVIEEVKEDPKLIEEANKIYNFYINKVKGSKCGYDYKEFDNKRIIVYSFSDVFYENYISYKESDENEKWFNEEKIKQQLHNLDSVKDFLFKIITQYNYKLV